MPGTSLVRYTAARLADQPAGPGRSIDTLLRLAVFRPFPKAVVDAAQVANHFRGQLSRALLWDEVRARPN